MNRNDEEIWAVVIIAAAVVFCIIAIGLSFGG